MEKLRRERISEAFEELKNSIKYMNDSKQGRMSMESFLDAVSRSTDKVIIDTENNKAGEKFTDGSCHVSYDGNEHRLYFDINLYFKNEKNERICKNVSFEKEEGFFTREVVGLFEEEDVLLYNIDSPMGD